MKTTKRKDSAGSSSNYVENGLLTPEDVAILLRIDLRTLANWRYRGCGPVFTKLGGIVRYTRDDVNSFVLASRQKITGHALAA